MAVEDVTIPPRKFGLDPKTMAAVEKPQGPDYWAQKAEEARARREYIQEEKAVQQLNDPPPPPESPFKVEGKVNLGTFDLQADRQRAQEMADQARRDAESSQAALREELAKTSKELNDAKMSLMMKEVTTQFNQGMQSVQQQIAAISAGKTNGDNSSLLQTIETMEALAQKMGWARQQAGPSAGGGSDPRLQIELAKITLEEANRNREFQLKLKQYDIEMNRQSRLDEQNLMIRREELAQKAKRDQMIASLPEQLGSAFAKGMLAEGGLKGFGGAGAPVAQRVSAQPPPPSHSLAPQQTPPAVAPESNAGAYLQVAPGESGTFNCPSCNQEIAIAADTTQAVCSGCDFHVPIVRKQLVSAQ